MRETNKRKYDALLSQLLLGYVDILINDMLI